MIDFKTNKHLHPKVKELLHDLEGKYLSDLGVQEAREFLSDYQDNNSKWVSGVTIKNKSIADVPCYIFTPDDVEDEKNIIVFIHGGGWVLSDYMDYEVMISRLAEESNMTIIFPAYTLSPEAKHPFALDQIYEVCVALSEQSYSLSICGNSAGGNMAIITTLDLIGSGYTVNSLVLMWPVCGKRNDTQSWQDYAEGYYLSAKDMSWFFDNYLEKDNERDWTIYPIEIPDRDLKLFPPTLINVSENDILRDEGELFGNKLMEVNADSTCIRYNGVIHDWGFLNGLSEIPQTKALLTFTSAFINKYKNNQYVL